MRTPGSRYDFFCFCLQEPSTCVVSELSYVYQLNVKNKIIGHYLDLRSIHRVWCGRLSRLVRLIKTSAELTLYM